MKVKLLPITAGFMFLILAVMLSLVVTAETRCTNETADLSIREDSVSTPIVTIDSTQILLDTAISHLKLYEGFRANPYQDVDGTWTIGYGHHMVDGWWKDSIPESFADSLLRVDLTKRINKVKDKYQLSDRRAIALGLFVFNCGPLRGSLKKAVLGGKSIDNLIINYCHYRLNGKVHKSKKLRKRRLFELMIYNGIIH